MEDYHQSANALLHLKGAKNYVYQKEVKPQDVLFGRGGYTNHRKGNMYYRDQVVRARANYEEARNATERKNAKKHEIARKLVKAVQERGGRFLMVLNYAEKAEITTATQVYRIANEKEALKKTKQALRDACKFRAHNKLIINSNEEEKKKYIPLTKDNYLLTYNYNVQTYSPQLYHVADDRYVSKKKQTHFEGRIQVQCT